MIALLLKHLVPSFVAGALIVAAINIYVLALDALQVGLWGGFATNLLIALVLFAVSGLLLAMRRAGERAPTPPAEPGPERALAGGRRAPGAANRW